MRADRIRRRWRRCSGLLAAAIALSSPTIAARDPIALTPPAAASAQCLRTVLGDLGWRIALADVPTATIHAGLPCERADLADAHAAGDLVAQLPAAADDTQITAALTALLDHPATLCAYDIAVGDATRRAVDRLVANRRYRFSALQLGWIGFGASGPGADGWERTRAFGRGFRPAGSNRRAIEGFYSGAVRSECGVGRQIAQLATQAELYGADAFDRVFAADELSIGTFVALHDTRSILLGSSAGDFVRDGSARRASQSGRQAFSGLPGFVVHAFDRDTLDDIHNQAQNFVVYDVGDAAADALRRHDGFEHYNRINHALWELSRDVDPGTWRRGFERLLIERDASLRADLPADMLAIVKRMDALLDDPFYREFRIYVHKHGVQPVGFHVVRMFDRNPRTPYRIELALHNVQTTLFRRYVAHRLDACRADAATH